MDNQEINHFGFKSIISENSLYVELKIISYYGVFQSASHDLLVKPIGTVSFKNTYKIE